RCGFQRKRWRRGARSGSRARWRIRAATATSTRVMSRRPTGAATSISSKAPPRSPTPIFINPRPGSAGQRAHRAGGNAAVDKKELAGDVGARVGGEENERALQVFDPAGTVQGNPFLQVRHPLRILVEDGVLLG